MKTTHIASAIIRKDNHILMVQQADEDGFYWFIAGGVIETGELLNDAIIREVQEEAGLTVNEVGKLAYVTQTYNPQEAHHSIAFVVEIDSWSGSLQINDPDNLIHNLAFVPISEAIERLNRAIWRPMREPLQAYLQGKAVSGAVWQYRQESFREFELISCLK
jgi:8-oxo-dGTP diphosphatase